MRSEMLDYEPFHVHASTNWAWLVAAGSLAGQGGIAGGLGTIGAREMLRHPFESEWNQLRQQRDVDEVVRHREFVGQRPPQRRIRRLVGRSIVSIGGYVGRSLVSIGSRLAAEPARSVARPR